MLLSLQPETLEILQEMKTLKQAFSIIIVLLFLSHSAMAQGVIEVEGEEVKTSLKLAGESLKLNGAGIREKYWIDLYVGALYTSSKESNAQKLIQADAPMCLQLRIVSGLIDSETMVEAVEEGFEKATKGNTIGLRAKIDAFKKAFSEPIENQDTYHILYVPNKGTRIYKNKSLKQTIDGLDFKQALFAIWLGEDPADEDLKEGMLGLDD